MIKKWAKVSFTLIELLVVVAIMAILLTLLLPALHKAKKTVRQITCSSNLRQLCIGAQSYASDYDGYPPYRLGTSGWYLPVANGGMGDYVGVTYTAADYGKLPVLVCPEVSGSPVLLNYKCGYLINEEIRRVSNSKPPIRLTRISNPSVMSLFICADGVNSMNCYTRYDIRGGAFGRLHPSQRTNAGHIDGHSGARYVITGDGGDYSQNWEWFVVPPYNDHWW
jgi:prepilin-type N-terminal cleavage/methylation domain-containing protein